MPQEKRPCKVTSLICDALCTLIEENKSYETLSLQKSSIGLASAETPFIATTTAKRISSKKNSSEICEESDHFFREKADLNLYEIVYSIAAVMERNRRFLLCFYQASAKLYFDTLIRQIEKSNTPKPISSLRPR
jgi:hypothetical protein